MKKIIIPGIALLFLSCSLSLYPLRNNFFDKEEPISTEIKNIIEFNPNNLFQLRIFEKASYYIDSSTTTDLPIKKYSFDTSNNNHNHLYHNITNIVEETYIYLDKVNELDTISNTHGKALYIITYPLVMEKDRIEFFDKDSINVKIFKRIFLGHWIKRKYEIYLLFKEKESASFLYPKDSSNNMFIFKGEIDSANLRIEEVSHPESIKSSSIYDKLKKAKPHSKNKDSIGLQVSNALDKLVSFIELKDIMDLDSGNESLNFCSNNRNKIIITIRDTKNKVGLNRILELEDEIYFHFKNEKENQYYLFDTSDVINYKLDILEEEKESDE